MLLGFVSPDPRYAGRYNRTEPEEATERAQTVLDKYLHLFRQQPMFFDVRVGHPECQYSGAEVQGIGPMGGSV